MRILINTISTKKHSGGAFQIANNFIRKSLEHPEVEWIYVVSSDLDAILPEEMKGKGNYHVFPTQPDFKGSYKRVKQELKALEQKINPDVVYSITAPSYFSFERPEVMRFTNPLVAHPNKYSWKVQPLMAKIRLMAYCWNQKRLIKNTKYFITQTETTKQGIMRITGLPSKNVCVVNNVLPAAFANQDTSHIDTGEDWIDIACVGAPVPHKNFDILPDVILELNKRGINNVRFHTTIPEDLPIWKVISSQLKSNGIEKHLVNHGRVTQAELAEIYRRCEYAYLPTLLEVFSASTVEAMYFDLKIVATDFGFNREVLGDACLYYEPMNASDAAAKFDELIHNQKLQKTFSDRMKKQLSKYDDYDKHFNAIEDFLVKVANGKLG
jgi:glycosyltransferase involved in cell wall biosynthesis